MGGTEPPDPGEAGRIGSTVGHYRVLAEIGRGGMGVVYRAVDLRLGREVALKCPRPDRTRDERIRQRFLQEARNSSKLSHPNIVAVYEVFEHDGEPWLATELVRGQDLRSLIAASGSLPVDDILRHGEGLSEALHVAHSKGFLHRDVKPQNVLIGEDGRARLADFGLARAFVPREGDSAVSTKSASLTGEGRVVGTPGYMSPEQVLGKPIDARSDLFCLGALLYEMCTGRPAFQASDEGDWVDALLYHEPTPISKLNYEIPEELERIVRKALSKRPDERYQHASEMLADLRAHRRRFESSSVSGEAAAVPARGRRFLITATSAAAALVALAWAAATIVPKLLPSRSAPFAGAPRQITRGRGCEREPAISPDGSLVAFSSDESGNFDVYLADVRGGAPLRLTDDPAADVQPAWLPDGSAVVFATTRGGRTSVWKVPRLGGAAVPVVDSAEAPAISPDGARIAFARPDVGGFLRITVAPLADPARARTLTGPDDGLWGQSMPDWSPDGRTICYEDFRDVWTVPADGGPSRRVTTDHAFSRDCRWSHDGSALYHSSFREGTQALWRIPAAGGTPERLTLGTGPERQPSVARDGSRLAYSTLDDNPDIVLLDRVTRESTRLVGPSMDLGPCLRPDGSALAFVSDREGKPDLWLQPLAGMRAVGPPRKLTDEPGTAATPRFSPDGKWIAYFRVVEGQRDIWILAAEGGLPSRYTDDPAVDIHPAWSPDGKRIVFSSNRDGAQHLWVAPVADGRPAGPARRLTSGDSGDVLPSWSPDGLRIAYTSQGAGGTEISVVAADGGSAPKRLTRGAGASVARWDASNGSLVVSGTWGGTRMTLRRVLVPGGEVLPFEPPVFMGEVSSTGECSISRDGNVVAFVYEENEGDVWMLEGPPGSY